MNLIFRYFFKTLRLIVTPPMLLINWITTPKSIEYTQEQQAEVNKKIKFFTLYQFPTCPFCIKVRRQMKRLSMDIKLCNAQSDAKCRQELLEQGGKLQAPCLKITDSKTQKVTWMYESDAIINFLNQQAPVTD